MPLAVSNKHQMTITIDDEPVTLLVARMTRQQALDFEREFRRHGQRRGDPEAFNALPEKEREAVNDDVLRFMEGAISSLVTVAEGQITDDGRPVSTGDDLLRAFPGRWDVLAAAYQAIYAANFMGKAQKNALCSQPIFFPGSQRSTPTVDGDGPASTAMPVAGNGSASSARVTAGPEPLPSGSF